MLKRLFSNTIEIPPVLAESYIPSLDGIRAISIITVIIAHINNAQLHVSILFKVFQLGGLGVQIFFVISGFLITTLLLKEQKSTGNIDLKRFYIRRSLRIVPVAVLYLLVILILNIVFKLGLEAKNFLYPLTYTQNFNSSPDRFTQHFWSLSVEEQFYLLFPFILKKSIRAYLITALFIIISSPIFIIFKYHILTQNIYLKGVVTYLNIFLNMGLVSILIGSVFAILLCKYPVLSKIKLKGIEYIQCATIFLFWLIFNFPVLPFGIGAIVTPILISFFIFSLINYRESFIFKIFNTKPMITVGLLSYSLYIWQQIFTVHQPWKGLSTYSDSLALNLCAMVVIAYLSYNFYEKPFLLLKKRFETVKNTHLS